MSGVAGERYWYLGVGKSCSPPPGCCVCLHCLSQWAGFCPRAARCGSVLSTSSRNPSLPGTQPVLTFQTSSHASLMKAPWNVGLCSQSRSPELGIQQSQAFHSLPAPFVFLRRVSWGGGGARVPWSHSSGTLPCSFAEVCSFLQVCAAWRILFLLLSQDQLHQSNFLIVSSFRRKPLSLLSCRHL